MRISFIGQRGIPATYGGIERYVEEIGARLAARGHEVTVWCRTNYGERQPDDEYRGMSLRYLHTVETKQLDAIVPSIVAGIHSLHGYDVVHYQAIGPGVTSVLSRARRRTLVVQTIHGLDHKRGKWGGSAKFLLRQAAWLSAHVPHEVIVVSRSLRDHYEAAYDRQVTWIRNGVADPQVLAPGATLASLGLTPGRYALFVGRLVPEKAPALLVEAFAEVDDPGVRLVLVGGSSFTDELVEHLDQLAAADRRVVLAGYRYHEELAELYSNAGAFVLPSHLEGLPLTLLEAISYGLPVVTSDIPPHIEVLEEDGPGHRLVPEGSISGLGAAIADTLRGGEAVAAGAAALRDRVRASYSWELATDAVEQVYVDGLSRLRQRR